MTRKYERIDLNEIVQDPQSLLALDWQAGPYVLPAGRDIRFRDVAQLQQRDQQEDLDRNDDNLGSRVEQTVSHSTAGTAQQNPTNN